MPARTITHRPSSTSYASPSADREAAAVVILVRRSGQSQESLRFRAAEFEALLREVSVSPACEVLLTRSSSGARPLFGPGTLRELAELSAALREKAGGTRTLVVVDAALSPGEQRSLANAVGCEVLDRTQVILRLFALRARTREAQLTVQIAQQRYALPRLREDTHKRGRQGGGGGRGERGNTLTALEKERARARIRALERELERVQRMAETQREARRSMRRVALVGYTNAGKSSWLRALTGSETLIADKPFATLGTTVRTLARKSASPEPVLITDTVGFLDDLPHELVPSFHATLVEAREADLLLCVVDASDPHCEEQLEVTERTLESIGAADTPRLILLNKIDRLDALQRTELGALWPHALQVSVDDETCVARVRALITGHFELPE